MDAADVQARLFILVDEMQAGEEIVITRLGKAVAVLRPVKSSRALEGMFTGKVVQKCTDEELYSTGETWEAS